MFSRTCKLTNCKCNMRLVLTNLHQTLPKHGLIPNISVTCNLNVSRIFVGVLNNSHFAWGVSPSNAVFTVVIGFIRNCYELLFFACVKSRHHCGYLAFMLEIWVVFHLSLSRIYSCPRLSFALSTRGKFLNRQAFFIVYVMSCC